MRKTHRSPAANPEGRASPQTTQCISSLAPESSSVSCASLRASFGLIGLLLTGLFSWGAAPSAPEASTKVARDRITMAASVRIILSECSCYIISSREGVQWVHLIQNDCGDVITSKSSQNRAKYLVNAWQRHGKIMPDWCKNDSGKMRLPCFWRSDLEICKI